MAEPLYPLLLTPSLHIKVWGGRKLEQELGKKLLEDAPYGEAWELHDTSIIENGVHAGKTVADLIQLYGTNLIGAQFDPAEGLPLLVKLLDANDWLSVQVHPNDEQAKALEGDPRGKTEAWVILEGTEPNAKLVIGMQAGTTQQAMADAIRDNTLEAMLEYALVKAGDVLYMPANTVHAIGPGILLYEVQQSSNITYRLYDWGRMGLDGTPRELHIEKGVQVSNLEKLPYVRHPSDNMLVNGEYFQTQRHNIRGLGIDLTPDGAFHSLTCIDGSVRIEHPLEIVELNLGQTALIPATLGTYALVGNGTVLRSYMV